MSDDDRYVIDERELYEAFRLTAEATEAAATGDPNECASKAADAKAKLLEIHQDGEFLSEVTQ